MNKKVLNRKVAVIDLSILSAAVWWECPLITFVLSAFAAVTAYCFYNNSFVKKLILTVNIVCVFLSIYNFDLHIGIKLLEFFHR